MDSTTARLGIPLYMWRIFVWPLAVSLLIYIGCNGVFIFILFSDDAMDVVLRGPVLLGLLFALPVLSLLFIGFMAWILFKRASRYRLRFQKRNGWLCFRCDYDLFEGQHTCPECGSAWEPEKLKVGWKKMVNQP